MLGLRGSLDKLEEKVIKASNFLINQIGLESSLYFLDFLTNVELEPKNWCIVSAYVMARSASSHQLPSETLCQVYRVVRGCLKSDSELPFSRKTAYQLKYDLTSKLTHPIPLIFMNYGYQPDDSSQPLCLGEHDPNFKYSVQLYHHLASLTDFRGRNVLEVGGGNGGGADYVSRTFSTRSFLATDFCLANVRFSNEHFKREGLDFQYADAEELPFTTPTFDRLLNVESFHCYPSPLKFLQGSALALFPGGKLLLADFFKRDQVDLFRQLATQSSFDITYEEDITADVSRALPLYLETLQLLADRLPQELRSTYSKFINSRSFNNPVSNWGGHNLVYHIFVLKKTERQSPLM